VFQRNTYQANQTTGIDNITHTFQNGFVSCCETYHQINKLVDEEVIFLLKKELTSAHSSALVGFFIFENLMINMHPYNKLNKAQIEDQNAA